MCASTEPRRPSLRRCSNLSQHNSSLRATHGQRYVPDPLTDRSRTSMITSSPSLSHATTSRVGLASLPASIIQNIALHLLDATAEQIPIKKTGSASQFVVENTNSYDSQSNKYLRERGEDVDLYGSHGNNNTRTGAGGAAAAMDKGPEHALLASLHERVSGRPSFSSPIQQAADSSFNSQLMNSPSSTYMHSSQAPFTASPTSSSYSDAYAHAYPYLSASTSPSTISIINPSHLLPLLELCRSTYHALSFHQNPSFYARLYRMIFDSAAVDRRWNQPSLPRDQFQHHSSHPPQPYRHPEAPSYSSSSAAPGVGIFRVDDRLLADEYRDRISLIRRMKMVARYQRLDVNGITRRSDVERDLWAIWFMITEHDVKNIHILESLACVAQYAIVIYHSLILAGATKPGFPEVTVETSLFNWIIYRLGLDRGLELSSEEIDEKIFIHRPWVFACHRYPSLIAPWIFRNLPINSVANTEEDFIAMSRPNAFMSDLSPKKMSVPVQRFGRTWEILPPSHVDASALMLLGLVDRFPEVATLAKKPDAPGMHEFFHRSFQSSSSSSSRGNRTYPSDSPARRPSSSRHDEHDQAREHPYNDRPIQSNDYDDEFIRSLSCASPIDSQGLPPLFYRGKIQGHWKGRTLFMDFDAYRSVLAGNLRSLYDGAFGFGEQEWTLEESVINVKIDKVGGDGPSLAAGFLLDEEGNELEMDPSEDAETRGWEPCLDEHAPDRPGWTKEILVSGRGHSYEGEFIVKGRVRSWDGLLTLWVHIAGVPVGKWIYRSYIQAGGLNVGRWRDTFTPENMRAFEAPYSMLHVDGPLYADLQREHRQRQKKQTKHEILSHAQYELDVRVLNHNPYMETLHSGVSHLPSIRPPPDYFSNNHFRPPNDGPSLSPIKLRTPPESNMRSASEKDREYFPVPPPLPMPTPMEAIDDSPPSLPPIYALERPGYGPRRISDASRSIVDPTQVTSLWSRSLASGSKRIAPDISPPSTTSTSSQPAGYMPYTSRTLEPHEKKPRTDWYQN